MPVNKNTLTRYRILDELLSDQHHQYSMKDLREECNSRLLIMGYQTISKRTIEKDLHAIELLFNAFIEDSLIEGKPHYRYADRRFSIFRKELKPEEQNLLAEFLNTLGQFEGLTHFEWFEAFRRGICLEKRPKIISFSNNPYLHNSNLLGTLFDNISNRVVVELTYHKFSDDTARTIIVHPYLLKQYNDRWFLICAADEDDKILTFALDRIDDVTPLPARKYRKCKKDLSERFEDIIGVTYYEDRPVEHITFWVSDKSKDYVTTKPIHASQTHLRGPREQQLREQYPKLDGGAFFTIDCIQNYELIRELSSYGGDLLVLSPSNIQEEVYNRIIGMMKNYSKVRTNAAQ